MSEGLLGVIIGGILTLAVAVLGSLLNHWLSLRNDAIEARRERTKLIRQRLLGDRIQTAEVMDFVQIARAEGKQPDLGRANLQKVDLRDQDLQGVKLFRADLTDADLGGADLREADLSRAILFRADLEDANLQGANLRGANLVEADLRGAKLNGADLMDANLLADDLYDRILRAKLEGAVADHHTTWPEGFEIPEGVVIEERE